ncbi:MAG: hypothetical protein WC602_01635 [archaeon]
MKAIIEVKNIAQDWKPPFQKKIDVKEFTVDETKEFDEDSVHEFVFRLCRINGDKCQIEYNRGYTLKGYEQPGDRKIWLESGESKEISQLWNSNGITKKVTLKQLVA